MLSFALALCLCLGLGLAPAQAAGNHQASDWARQEVSDAVMEDLSPFPPFPEPLDYQGAVTRREYAGLAVRLYGALTLQYQPILAKEASPAPFGDVSEDGDINAAYALGLMNGVPGGRFEPERSISRQEICTLLQRVAEKSGATLPQTNTAAADALIAGSEGSIPDWATEGAWALVASGLMKGTGAGYDLLGTTSREQALVLSLRMLRAIQAQPPLLGQRSPHGWAFAVENADQLMARLTETMPKAPDTLVFYTRQPVTQADLSARGLPVDGNYTVYPELAAEYGLNADGWFMACDIQPGPAGYANVCTLKPDYETWAYLDQYRNGLRSTLPPGSYAWANANWVKSTPANYKPLMDLVEKLEGTVVTAGMSDYEKAKALHDYVAEHLTYDYDEAEVHKGGGSNLEEDLRAYGAPVSLNAAIVTGKGVCAAYANMYNALCNLFGLRCVEITGTAGGGAHAWNAVEVDGAWYLVDVTWDDHSPISYRYFLISDATMGKDHKTYTPYPLCPEDYPRPVEEKPGPTPTPTPKPEEKPGPAPTPTPKPEGKPAWSQRPAEERINPAFPGTFLGETADGVLEFELTIPADKKNQPYPVQVEGIVWIQGVSDDRSVVATRAQYLYGYGPGETDVTYNVRETRDGPVIRAAVIHVTVTEK